MAARLYDEILGIARNYMGAAAEDYIRRRIRIVSNGAPPEEVTADRLGRLAAGVEMTAKGYMSERRARSFVEEIRALESERG